MAMVRTANPSKGLDEHKTMVRTPRAAPSEGSLRPPLRTRRWLLQALGATCALGVLGVPEELWAAPKQGSNGKLGKTEQSPMGTTLWLGLNHAPFAEVAPYNDNTVIVFVPSYYRLPKSGLLDVVLHFHGHNTTAQRALEQSALREQLTASKQNAILVVPQGPIMAPDSSGGKLEKPKGLRKLLRELTGVLGSTAVAKSLGEASCNGAKDVGMLCLSAHSGGFHVAAACLGQGGHEVSETYLFDALYGDLAAFKTWVLDRKGRRGRGRHKLISYFTWGKTRDNNLTLCASLRAAGIDCLLEEQPGTLSRAELTKATAVFLSAGLAHGEVTFGHNNLRDCLFASGLKRNVPSDWFDAATGPRPIDSQG
jgi:hypothetical protein